MAEDEAMLTVGDNTAASVSNYGRYERNSGSRMLYACIDMAVHQDPKKTISKDELMSIAANCRNDIGSKKFTEFTYGLAYSPEFVKQVNEAIQIRVEQLQEEQDRLERAKAAVEIGEKNIKEAREKLEKLKQAAKSAGLKEVI